MQHLVDRLQQDRGSNLHRLPHCGGSNVRREFAWKTSQSRTCSRPARGTSIAWNQRRRAMRRLRKCARSGRPRKQTSCFEEED